MDLLVCDLPWKRLANCDIFKEEISLSNKTGLAGFLPVTDIHFCVDIHKICTS